MKSTMRILVASTLLALSPLAPAQTTTTTTNTDIETQARLLDATAANKGQTLVAEKIAAFFTNLAGSKENAVALVTALRNGTAVSLTATTTGTGTGTGTGTTTTTTFTPPTGKMGWGNVKIALALAQDALLRAGITNPTSAQLQTALMGGTITKADGTTVTLKGVLQMRADGMGWGQIAQAGGTKLGPVVSSLKATQTQLAKLPAAGTTTTTATATTSKGVTTAAGASGTSGGKSSKGITTATGASSGAPGLVTAEGASSAAQPKGNAYGRGIVTGAGTSVGSSVAATGGGKPSTAGAGVVNAGGGNAAGVTTGQGNAGGSDNGKGKGKSGG
jgi:hypothetical protein